MLSLSKRIKLAYALIDTKDKWVQGMYAADINGRRIDEQSGFACKFCSMGAMYRVQRCTEDFRTSDIINMLNKSIMIDITEYKPAPISCDHNIGNVPTFNDSQPYESVQRVWLRAINMAEEEEHATC